MAGEQTSFTWSTRRDGNDGYVLEECLAWRKEFGPMPPHTVLAFVASRRRLVAMKMQEFGAAFVSDPQEYMQ